MFHINFLEDRVPVYREPAAPKEACEAALIIFFVAASFSVIVIVILNGLLSFIKD